MSELIAVAADALQELGWQFKRVENFPVLSVVIEAPNGVIDVFIHAHDERSRLLVYLRPQGLLIEPQHYNSMADYTTRANYGLPLGNFEFDMNDGELNFKNSVDIGGATLVSAMVKTLLLFGVETVNRYLPGIRAVLQGTPPKQAIEAIDGPTKVLIA